MVQARRFGGLSLLLIKRIGVDCHLYWYRQMRYIISYLFSVSEC